MYSLEFGNFVFEYEIVTLSKVFINIAFCSIELILKPSSLYKKHDCTL